MALLPSRRAWGRGAFLAPLIVLVFFATCLILLGSTVDFIVDWLWFSAIGYLGVFWTVMVAKAQVFLSVFLATAIVLWINGAVALRWARASRIDRHIDLIWSGTGTATLPDILDFMRDRLRWSPVIAGSAIVLATLVAWGELHNWAVFLRFLYQVPFGASDPLYGKDIGFYLFTLPAYVAVKNWMLITVLLSAALAGAVYWVHAHIEYHAQRRWISPAAIAHGSVLLGLFFAVKAWSYGLDRYLLLYGDNGVVVGASYTDIHIQLPILWLMIGLSIIAAFIAGANVRLRTQWLPAAAAVLVFGGSF